MYPIVCVYCQQIHLPKTLSQPVGQTFILDAVFYEETDLVKRELYICHRRKIVLPTSPSGTKNFICLISNM